MGSLISTRRGILQATEPVFEEITESL